MAATDRYGIKVDAGFTVKVLTLVFVAKTEVVAWCNHTTQC